MSVQERSDDQQLEETVEELRRAERVQKALFQISDLAGADLDTDEILKRLHQIIADLMFAENFYIFLYNAEQDTVRFRYFADSATQAQDVPPRSDIPLDEFKHSLTWYVIRLGRPLRGALDDIATTLPGPLKSPGAAARDWLGVPMLDGTAVKGLLVVQSYEQDNLYNEEDQHLLSFVASHVLTMLQRRQTRMDLERAVIARTEELALANQNLKEEVAQRRQSEKLQKALYHIAEQAGESDDERAFFALVHREIGELMYAENFFVALLVDDDTALEFGYYADEFRSSQSKRPLASGLTEYALRSENGVLLTQTRIESLIRSGQVQIKGPNAKGWIGVPLHCEGRTLGLLAVQSYRADQTYQQQDLELLRFVSRQIASTLERKRALSSLKEAKLTLEQRVAERTQELSEANAALAEQSLTDPLTGLRNRRYLTEQMPIDIALIDRQHRDNQGDTADTSTTRTSVLFLMLDIDHFKQVNDVYGHVTGDRVLTQVSSIINECIRKSDTSVRWGGEEFLLVARFTDADFAPNLAERLRRMMAEHVFDLGGGKQIHLTCSIGFSQYPLIPAAPIRIDWEEVINIADFCLYAAKQSWRDSWVGVRWGDVEVPESLPGRISPLIPELIDSSHLQLLSSRPDDAGLVWL